jgi:hypothetical protein
MSMLLAPGTDRGLLDLETMAVLNLARSRNTNICDKFQCAVSSSTWDVTLTKETVTEVGDFVRHAAGWYQPGCLGREPVRLHGENGGCDVHLGLVCGRKLSEVLGGWGAGLRQ